VSERGTQKDIRQEDQWVSVGVLSLSCSGCVHADMTAGTRGGGTRIHAHIHTTLYILNTHAHRETERQRERERQALSHIGTQCVRTGVTSMARKLMMVAPGRTWYMASRSARAAASARKPCKGNRVSE
jgi:hypothetical protein